MESQVTKPIEDQLSGISGIKNINSMTRKGRSMITVEFKLGWNMVEGSPMCAMPSPARGPGCPMMWTSRW